MPPGDERQVKDVGEAGILAAIRRIATAADSSVIVGIGDDGAVLRPSGSRALVATTDMLVEDVHFKLAYASAYDVGWKTLAINLSDIAAMGALPRYALISLALPSSLALSWVEALYQGISAIGALFGVTVVGGNLAQSHGPIIVDATVLGEVEEDCVVRRTGARSGDRLLVTGTLGASAVGRILLERSGDRLADDGPATVHLRPTPRVHEGRLVALSRWASAMMDLSDGLATDLWRMCEANGLGVWIDEAGIPVDPRTQEAATRSGVDAFEAVMFGGEDYELLIAAPAAQADALATRVRHDVGTPVAFIGEFVDLVQGRRVKRGGTWIPLEPRGWDHFRKSGDEPHY